MQKKLIGIGLGLSLFSLMACNLQTKGLAQAKLAKPSSGSKLTLTGKSIYDNAPILYDQVKLAPIGMDVNCAYVMQSFNKGRDLLILQYIRSLPLSGKEFQYAAYVYDYHLAQKKLTRFNNSDGKPLIVFCHTHSNGVAIDESGQYLYFISSKQLYPSLKSVHNQSLFLGSYDIKTQQVSSLLSNTQQYQQEVCIDGQPPEKLFSFFNQWMNDNQQAVQKKGLMFDGLSENTSFSIVVSPDQKTIYFDTWTDGDDHHSNSVMVYAMDLATKNLRLMGYSSVNIMSEKNQELSGNWLTLSPNGHYFVIQSDPRGSGDELRKAGFVVSSTQVQDRRLDVAPNLFQGNSQMEYHFLGFDPKHLGSFYFVRAGAQSGLSDIIRATVGSDGSEYKLSTLPDFPVSITGPSTVLFHNDVGEGISFSLWDINHDPLGVAQLKLFPELPFFLIFSGHRNMPYQYIEGSYVVFISDYGSSDPELYIYQYPQN